MKKIKLFLSLLMLIAFSVGNVWGADPAAVGATLFSENFGGYSNTDVPSGSVSTVAGQRVVYGEGSVTYTCTDGAGSSAGTTKVTTDNSGNLAGGTSPELMVGKKGTGSGAAGGSFSIAGIPSGDAKAITVAYKQNKQNLAVSVSGTGYSTTFTGGKPDAAGERTFDINIADGADATFTLTFQAAATSNVRVDDILITVKTAGEGAAPATPTCATPTFDPEDGETFTEDIDVEIACATTGATIYYTTDGTDPTTSSSVYSTALNFTETTTLKAMAVKTGCNNSAVVTATYTKVVPFDGSILEITKDDFVSSYASNNGDHEKDEITYTTNQVCLSLSSIQFQKTNGYLYNKTDLGEIVKIEITKTGSNNLIVYSGTTENPSSTEVTGSVSGNVTTYTFASGNGFFAIKCNSTAASNVDPIKIYYVYSAPAVATPTISGETPFVTTTTVTLACTTDGASIYYTTDGTDPSSSSTLYEDPFELNAGATVRAIAIKGSDESSIAAKEFEKVTSYSTLAEIFSKATEVGSTATDIYVTFGGWKVSAKTSNNVFLTDGTNGAVIYGNNHGFNAGDVLTGTAACKVQLYKGFAELTSLNSGTTGLTVTAGSVGDPVVKTWGQLSAVNTGALVKLENLTYNGTSLSDGENTIPTYTTFYSASFENGKKYNLTGVYQYYNTNGQILPRSAADVQEIIETFTVTYNNPDHGTLTIKNGDEVVTSGSAVNEGTVLTIVTNPAEGYKLVGITVNGSSYTETTLELTEDVTIAATFEENLAPEVETYILSEAGVQTSHLVSGMRVGDKVNLPLTAAECSKVFRGWDANADCSTVPTYAPGEEYTLVANNKLYAVYADANIVTPTDHALGSLTVGGTSGNTASEGYTYTSNKTNDKAGYTQDSGTKDADIVHLQIKAASQIINEEPSAIIVTAHLGAGADRDELTYPVNAVLVDAEGNNVGDPVVLTNSIPDKNGADFSANLPTANYADVRGVKISHMKEDGWNVRYYSMSFKYQTGGTTYDNYSTDCQAQVATPTFSPAAGTYTEVQNVTIASETEDVTIYYTTNGDEPATSSTKYTAAIPVNESMTIKAIAVKAGMANSAVATAEYTINLPLSTMDQIFAAATAASSTATDANIAFNNWVVSGVSTNGKNVFVTDGTKGFIIFDNGGEMGFAVGDVLSGTAACKVQLYKGAAELTTLSSSTEGLNVATGGVITPAVKAINALSGINTGAPVTINSVQFDGEYLTDGVNSIKPFNSLFAYDALENGKYYNVTGIYQQFDATKEILPRSAADIEEVSLSDPEISYTPASATIELGQSLPGTTFANPHELAISYSSNNEAVATVSNTGVIALGTETGTAVITASFAGNATYAPANVTYTITVNPASVSQNVVILAIYDTKYYAMSTTNASSAFTAIEVEYDGSKVTVNSEADKTAIQWTRKTSGDNTTFQTKDESPMYMKGTSTGAAMSLNANACNWNWDETNEYYYLGGRSFFYQATGGYFKNFSISDNMGKSGYSGKASVIVIDPANIVITSKVSAELAYNPASDEITEGDAWSAPTLVNPHTVAITSYNSDNEGVATVTDGGVIALAGGIGTAHITAHFAGDATYLEGDAVYTITVNEAGDDLSGTWTLASSVAAGDKIIIANVAVAGELLTMGAQNGSYREEVASTVDGENKLTPAAGTKVFTLVDASSFGSYEGFALQASNGNYLSSASNSSNNIKEVASVSDANAVWSIVISEGVAAIVAQGSYTRKVIRYNSGNTRFSCYAESNSMADVVIYKHGAAPEPPVVDYTEVRNGLNAGEYYTMCLDKAVTAVQGGTIWRVLSKAENGTDVILEEVELPLEAGRPYIFSASADKLEVVYNGAAVSTPVEEGNNGLIGSFTKKLIEQVATNYIIYNNALYFVNSGNVYVGEHRAYLDMTGVPNYNNQPQQGNAPRRRVTMAVHGPQVATGIDALNASDAPVKVLINGQLFILRGEKMYNVNGQLVK